MSRFFAISFFLLSFLSVRSQKINRKVLVLRHNIILTKADSLSSITLGNGRFAFTTDITGLQTFPLNYQKGVPLGTQSQWGQHRFIISQNLQPFHLGNLGFEITKKDGTPATLSDVQTIYQELNLWTGKLRSHFTIEGIPVEVATYCSGTDDAIGVKVRSPLIKDGRLKLRVVFPYTTGKWAHDGTNYTNEDKHESKILMSHENGAVIFHQIDTIKYYVGFKWEANGFVEQKNLHYFLIAPDAKTDLFQLTAKFTLKKDLGFLPSFIDVRTSSENLWKRFWSASTFISSGGTGKKTNEQERKTVLSKYLLKTHEHLQKL